MRRLQLIIALALAGASLGVTAGESVDSFGLAQARQRCHAADMQSHVRPSSRDPRRYEVNCVMWPARRIRLSRFRGAADVAQCSRMGLDSRIEVVKDVAEVSCVKPR